MPPFRDKFLYHRHNAKIAGTAFLLTFEEWLKIWTDSGHLHERGCRRGQYVMARFGDKGAYEVGNVKIIKAEENCREAHLGKKDSEEVIEAKRKRMLGFKHKPSTLIKMSVWQKGKSKPPQVGLAVAESNRRRRGTKHKKFYRRNVCLSW